MALNKDILGLALYTIRQKYSNKTVEELEAEFGTLEAARLQCCKDEADEFIKHITAFGVVNTTGTASAQTGKLT